MKNRQVGLSMKLHEEPSSGGSSFSMQTDRQIARRTDTTKLLVAFRNFENALKKG